MKKVILCCLCVFLLTGCESYSKDDLDKAYKDGYSEGQSDGYNKGQESGYESAKEAYIGDYDRGYEKGLEAGHDDGFDDGFNTGHSEGYNIGYDKGYEKGWEDCTSFITNYFTQSADTVDDSLEKTREATDASNIRAAYAEVVTYYLESGDAKKTITVTAAQTKAGWQTEPPPCISYIGKDRNYEEYYYAASVRGYIVGIDIDGSATPSVTAIE